MEGLYSSEWDIFEKFGLGKQMAILVSGRYPGGLQKIYRDLSEHNGNTDLPPIETLKADACESLRKDFGHGDSLDPDQLIGLGKTYAILGSKDDAERVVFKLLGRYKTPGTFSSASEIADLAGLGREEIIRDLEDFVSEGINGYREIRDFYIVSGMKEEQRFSLETEWGREKGTYTDRLDSAFKEKRETERELSGLMNEMYVLKRERKGNSFFRKKQASWLNPNASSFGKHVKARDQAYKMRISDTRKRIRKAESELESKRAGAKMAMYEYRKARFDNGEKCRKAIQEGAEKLGYGYDPFLEDLGVRKETWRRLKFRERKYLKGKAMDFLKRGEMGKTFGILSVLDRESPVLKNRGTKRLLKYLEGANWSGRGAFEKYLERKCRIRNARDALLCGSLGALGGSFMPDNPWPNELYGAAFGVIGLYMGLLLSKISEEVGPGEGEK